jgi:predicted nucleic acid-binding protein
MPENLIGKGLMTRETLFFDSNVFIKAFRDIHYASQIQRYLTGAYVFSLSPIVLMELWVGAKNHFEQTTLKKLERDFPVLEINKNHTIKCGQILNKISRKSILIAKNRRSLTWDILIAIGAKENNALIITENVKDFELISQYFNFSYQAP